MGGACSVSVSEAEKSMFENENHASSEEQANPRCQIEEGHLLSFWQNKFMKNAIAKAFDDCCDEALRQLTAQAMSNAVSTAFNSSSLPIQFTLEEAETFCRSVTIAKRLRADNFLTENEFTSSLLDILASEAASKENIAKDSSHPKMLAYGRIIRQGLQKRALELQSLFYAYADPTVRLLDGDSLYTMLCDCSSTGDKPTKEEVALFLQCIDNNGDRRLSENEFLDYMIRGSFQKKVDIMTFMSRSAMHTKLYGFITSIDALLEDHGLSDEEVNEYLEAMRKIELKQALGADAPMEGIGLPRQRGLPPLPQLKVRRKLAPLPTRSGLDGTGICNRESNPFAVVPAASGEQIQTPKNTNPF